MVIYAQGSDSASSITILQICSKLLLSFVKLRHGSVCGIVMILLIYPQCDRPLK